jgi:hypothetical protein
MQSTRQHAPAGEYGDLRFGANLHNREASVRRGRFESASGPRPARTRGFQGFADTALSGAPKATGT